MILKIIIGLLGGIIGGMGMGGGTLTIPLLTLVLSFSQIEAQGVNLIAFIPMSILAIYIHSKHKLVDFKAGGLLALFGCSFSIVGAIIANSISNKILKKIFAIFLILLAIYQTIMMIRGHIKNKKIHKDKTV